MPEPWLDHWLPELTDEGANRTRFAPSLTAVYHPGLVFRSHSLCRVRPRAVGRITAAKLYFSDFVYSSSRVHQARFEGHAGQTNIGRDQGMKAAVFVVGGAKAAFALLAGRVHRFKLEALDFDRPAIDFVPEDPVLPHGRLVPEVPKHVVAQHV